MKEFIMAALPWITIGLCIAILAALATRGKSKRKDGKKKTANYETEGMCLGMCFGSAIGVALDLNIGITLPIGMLLGLAIGSSIKKPDCDKENKD